MNKFAHLADLHLGANRHPVLESLERELFTKAIDKCVEENVDFVLICGDLFHVGIPDMSTVNYCVKKLKELYDAQIPVYVIFGSHDYNPNTDSIINILETAGLIKNVVQGSQSDSGKIQLKFIQDKKTGAKFVGLNARKGSIEELYYEILDLDSLENEKGFKIFCLHIGLSEFKPPHLAAMHTIPLSFLPKGFDYYAGGHIHQRVVNERPRYSNIVYPGPIFNGYPRDLEHTAKGENRGFFIVSFDSKVKDINFVELFNSESLVFFEYDCSDINSVSANDNIEQELESLDIENKIVLLKFFGTLSGGKTSDIKTWNYRNMLIEKGAKYVEVNKYSLKSKEFEAVRVSGEDIPSIEKKILRENIGAVQVTIDRLKNDKGSITALKLLELLRMEIKSNEKKGDYANRVVSSALELLGLVEDYS